MYGRKRTHAETSGEEMTEDENQEERKEMEEEEEEEEEDSSRLITSQTMTQFGLEEDERYGKNGFECTLCGSYDIELPKDHFYGQDLHGERGVQCVECAQWMHCICAQTSSQIVARYAEPFRCPKCRPEGWSPKLRPLSPSERKQRKWLEDFPSMAAVTSLPELPAIRVTTDAQLRAAISAIYPWRDEIIVMDGFDGLGVKFPENPITFPSVSKAIAESSSKMAQQAVRAVDVLRLFDKEETGALMPVEEMETYANHEELVFCTLSQVFGNSDEEKRMREDWKPQIVKDLGWMDRIDKPLSKKEQKEREKYVWPVEFPCVELYIVYSAALSYTSLHVDFAGSAVFFTLYEGEKLWILIKPTPANMAIFQGFLDKGDKGDKGERGFDEWAGELYANAKDVYKFTQTAGQTIFLPGGWPHIVFTKKKSLVLTGSFWTDLNFETPMRCTQQEEAVAEKVFNIGLPFHNLVFLRALVILKDLKNQVEVELHVVEGLETMVPHLQRWIDEETKAEKEEKEKKNKKKKSKKEKNTADYMKKARRNRQAAVNEMKDAVSSYKENLDDSKSREATEN